MKRKNKFKGGFTYVELIVVMSIFAIMTSIVIFNYGSFQAKVDVKNYASDIALKIVQAQKDAISGRIVPLAQQYISDNGITNWKPSYGVYFSPGLGNKNFVYFTDLNNTAFWGDPGYEGNSDKDGSCSFECLQNINITKGIFVKEIKYFNMSGESVSLTSGDLDITFTRPNSTPAVFAAGSPVSNIIDNFNYVQITISSPQGASANINVYSSGRIQIN